MYPKILSNYHIMVRTCADADRYFDTHLNLVDLRSLESLGIRGIADLDRLDSLDEQGAELVVHAALDQYSRTGGAGLTHVLEYSKHGPLGSFLQVGLFEDDVGRLAAQFKGDGFHIGFSSGFDDPPSGGGRTSESDLRRGSM